MIGKMIEARNLLRRSFSIKQRGCTQMKPDHEWRINIFKGTQVIWTVLVLLMVIILCSGCPLKKQVKKEVPEVVLKKEPIMVYSFDDSNNNSKFEPWYHEKILEEKWFFRENDNVIIYIPHERARKGDEVSYLITSPNGLKIINKYTLTSDGGCLKIQAGCEMTGEGKDEKRVCTKVGKYLSAKGGYGTFEIKAFVNNEEIGVKEIKIGPTD
ncbi:MAG: hypothetical protein JXM72_07085 [Deltaproteobacteria bacterium]|nr:hypothetical protein [Deltaproteobacteria bacterium]